MALLLMYFFSADEERPRLLEKEGKAQMGTRYTYALGKLVLWSPIDGFIDSEGLVLNQKDFSIFSHS